MIPYYTNLNLLLFLFEGFFMRRMNLRIMSLEILGWLAINGYKSHFTSWFCEVNSDQIRF